MIPADTQEPHQGALGAATGVSQPKRPADTGALSNSCCCCRALQSPEHGAWRGRRSDILRSPSRPFRVSGLAVGPWDALSNYSSYHFLLLLRIFSSLHHAVGAYFSCIHSRLTQRAYPAIVYVGLVL